MVGTVIAGVITAGTAASGIIAGGKAKKINRQAEAIQKNAIQKFEHENSTTQAAIDALNHEKQKVIDISLRFADAMQRIHHYPKMKAEIKKVKKLSAYHPKKIRCLNPNINLAVYGLGGGAIAGIAGLAMFGVKKLTLGLTGIGVGVGIAAGGFHSKAQAEENKEDAERIAEEVDVLSERYKEICRLAKVHTATISDCCKRFERYLRYFETIVAEKKEWNDLSNEEKENTQKMITVFNFLINAARVEIERRFIPNKLNVGRIEQLRMEADNMSDQSA